jgi:hypothetical protein
VQEDRDERDRMGAGEILAGVTAAAIGGLYLRSRGAEYRTAVSEVDGHPYLVLKLPDHAEAADAMARLNSRAEALIARLGERHPDDPRSSRVADRYSRTSLSEGGREEGATSYSVNKGQSIVLCLRSKDAEGRLGRVQDLNTLTYVVIHELAHLSTDEIGHTKEFWDNFRFLLEEAVGIGVYEHVDYSSSPAGYCGITIKSNALGGSRPGGGGG